MFHRHYSQADKNKSAETREIHTDIQLGTEMLKVDPLFDKIPPVLIPKLVENAIVFGKEKSKEITSSYNTTDPYKLSEKLGIRVLFDIEPMVSIPQFRVLSRYHPKPPTIVIYENILRQFKESLAKRNIEVKNFFSNTTQICIAHEIFHHIERTELSFVNFAFRVDIINLGFIKLQKSLVMLGEIAAHSFSKYLLKLPLLPCFLDSALFGNERIVYKIKNHRI